MLAAVFFATVAGAQTAPPSAAVVSPPAWTVTVGFETFWLRDIAKGTRPIDASPVEWKGEGPAIAGHYDRHHHHVEGSFSSASSFALASPVQTLSASSNDRVRRLAGRYEYRWYPFRNVAGVDGLDLGVGAEADANHLSMSRHYPSAIEVRSQVVNVGGSGVVAIRWAASRLHLQGTLGNGLTIGHNSTRHVAAAVTEYGGWGGGWQTCVNVRAAVPVHARTAVAAGYRYAGEARFASHDSFTFGGSRFWAGVTYEP